VALQNTTPVAVIGAALDLGQDRRGVDMGPSAIRYAGLDERLRALGLGCVDHGNVFVPLQEEVEEHDARLRYLPEIKSASARLAEQVLEASRAGARPLVLGGDHSVALGTLWGLARAHGTGGAVWIDAHADVNTPETSPSGNVHGMVLAAALGLCGGRFDAEGWPAAALDPRRVALVGLRSVDDGERETLRRLGLRVFTMSHLDRIGIERAMREALDHVSGSGFVHVSLDLDAVDPTVAPGVGTPVPGGLSYREAHLAMELVAESGIAGSFEVVEVNPILDRANMTAALAVDLVASAFGASIL
jgi:arginase